MVERLAKFGVGGTTMDADDVTKRWSVLDTTPFPEFTEEGDLVEKEYVGLLCLTPLPSPPPPSPPPESRHHISTSIFLPGTASSRLSTSTGVVTWILTSAFPT